MLSFIFSVLTNGLPCCLLALGVFLTFRLLDFADMTAEGSLLIGGAITITCIKIGINPFLATFFAFLGGLTCGTITGFLNRILKVPKLLSGIITMTASSGVVFIIMGWDALSGVFNSQVSLTDQNTIFNYFQISGLNGNITNALVMSAILLIVLIIVYYFFGTEFGMAIRTTGMNEKMASAQGINTNFATIFLIAISNAIISLGGSLIAQESRSVTPIDFTGYLVIGLASILIGEAIFGKRSFKNWLISISLGSIVYFIIIEIALKLGFPQQLKNILYAVLITIALTVPLVKKSFVYLGKISHFKKEQKEYDSKNAVDFSKITNIKTTPVQEKEKNYSPIVQYFEEIPLNKSQTINITAKENKPNIYGRNDKGRFQRKDEVKK